MQTVRYRLIAHVALASASLSFLWLFSAGDSVGCAAEEIRFGRQIDLSSDFVDAVVDVDIVDCASCSIMVVCASFTVVLVE